MISNNFRRLRNSSVGKLSRFEQAQVVLLLEADAIVDAICRRLTEIAASCANLS